MKSIRFRLTLLANPVTLFVTIALLFGTYFVLTIPPLWGVDEYTHFDRAFQISKGVIVPHKVNEEGYGGLLPENLVKLNQVIHLDLADNKPAASVFHRKDVDDPGAYQKLVSERPSRDYVDFPFNGAAVYSPGAYIPSIAGILAGRAAHLSLGHIILLARFASLVFFVAVVVLAIWLVPAGGVKWLLFALGLVPMTVFQAAIVNADAVCISMSILIAAITVRILNTKKAPAWVWALLAAASVVLPLAKPSYIVISGVAVLLAFFKARRGLWHRLALALALAAAIAVPVLAWNYAGNVKTVSTAGIVSVHDVNASRQVQSLIHSPGIFLAGALPRTVIESADVYLISMVGALGWNFVPLPVSAVVLIWITLVLAALYAQPAASKRWSGLLLALSVLAAAAIFLSLYIIFSTVGGGKVYGVQGRYFIPILPFALLSFFRFIPVKVSIKPGAAAAVFSGSALITLGTAAVYYYLGTF